MPKSKKTRAKKYHPRTVKVGPYWPAEAQADVEDTLNWFLGLLYKRYEHLNQQEINEVGPIAMAARKAINDISDRQLKGQTKGFVATGDEIKIISQAFAIIIPTLKEAVALAPHKTLNEFTWAYERAKEKLKRSSNAKRESN